MDYEIFDAPKFPRRRVWGRALDLEIGQAFIIPWADLHYKSEPNRAVSSALCYLGKRVGRKFSTHKTERGVLVERLS